MALPNYEYKSEFAREYFAKGQLQPLAHQFERRLGRSLTPEERSMLTLRIREQGAERVGDVVLDLSGEDLADWLAAKNGR